MSSELILEVGEAVPLSPVEVAFVEVEKYGRMLRELRREKAELREMVKEAAAHLDTEKLSDLQERRRELDDELVITEAHHVRYRLNLAEAERGQVRDELRGLAAERERVAELWREAAEMAMTFQEEHARLSVETRMREVKLENIRGEEREARERLSELIDSMSEGEVL